MVDYIPCFILIPFAGFVLSNFILTGRERLISSLAFITVAMNLTALATFVGYWVWIGLPVLNYHELVIYTSQEYTFAINLFFDKISATYAIAGAFLALLVTTYSRVYLHREKGHKRFFVTLLLFFLGYNITIFSGNFETLFLGWEILGISSFLLIAFYRERYLPVRNALKVFTVYRIGDVGILLAMWMSHHLFEHNVRFSELANETLVSEHLQNQSTVGFFISMMLLITAAAKSAQLPFSSWLPRAMEGPTPSSAIFYGSLSVHLGAFLLLRTFPFWEHQMTVRILIALLGISSSLVCTAIARVQSSIKSQIAYASSAQIGLIFVEVAAGFDNLALVHFAGNAFLRTYQLLVSPSVVSYLIREQFYNFTPRTETIEDSFPKKVMNTVYVLSLREFNLDLLVAKYFWNPLKFIGKKIPLKNNKMFLFVIVPLFILGITFFLEESVVPPFFYHKLPYLYSFLAFILVLKAFTERKDVFLCWSLIIANHYLIAFSLSFNEHYQMNENLIYLSGITVAGVAGYILLYFLIKKEKAIDLSNYQGHSYEHPRLTLLFLMAVLGLSGFPISPSFIGEDLIFSHIHSNQFLLAFFVSMSFILNGLSLVRIYARVFLGPHHKAYHEIPYKSS
ncbi:MAG TPA: proton-conducting transporter membrane subunit [Bacteroidia bacterium]|nr:proton-conducting transporter membrane subunit [Bacteroidia bacterium]